MHIAAPFAQCECARLIDTGVGLFVQEQKRLQQAERARSLLNLITAAGLKPDEPRKSRLKKLVCRKVITRLQLSTGSGETTGSHFHRVEIEMVNTFAARSLLWELPRQGPTKRGRRLCYNWEVSSCACAKCLR